MLVARHKDGHGGWLPRKSSAQSLADNHANRTQQKPVQQYTHYDVSRIARRRKVHKSSRLVLDDEPCRSCIVFAFQSHEYSRQVDQSSADWLEDDREQATSKAETCLETCWRRRHWLSPEISLPTLDESKDPFFHNSTQWGPTCTTVVRANMVANSQNIMATALHPYAGRPAAMVGEEDAARQHLAPEFMLDHSTRTALASIKCAIIQGRSTSRDTGAGISPFDSSSSTLDVPESSTSSDSS